jgi:pilus assembly protein Flp/PilA
MPYLADDKVLQRYCFQTWQRLDSGIVAWVKDYGYLFYSGEPMKNLVTATKKFVTKYITRSEEGATLAEYGLLLALIAVVCIAAITLLGTKISSMFQTLSTTI